ncbi:hypothetical protein HHK36_021157 [Tetracentron sinense]|uniref:Peptidase A1 domain-containing protein n=1 Tax=Tetracentron sinense TaxID=13715 RepID=A0A834YWC3_TETSI|nr:hypothetical protein HHK36_021157 [Tetracentron sinense]
METTFASSHSLFLFFFFTTFISFSFATTASTTKPHRLAIKLIHRDSIFSPFSNPKATIRERAERAFQTSISRLAYLQAKTGRPSSYSFHSNDIQAGVIADNEGIQFLANFSIGTPPVQTLVTMATGSDLLWVQCLPCTKCYNQSIPIFDPSKSSTYSILSCDSPSCIILPRDKACDSSQHCNYEYRFIDNASTKGNLATDVLTFESSKGTTTIPNMVFGCGHENEGMTGRQEAGTLGLGYKETSIVYQIGSDKKFSYCIGNISDPSYAYNQLVLGSGAIIEGYSTPIEIYNGFYYLNLEGISVGNENLNITPGIFDRTDSGGGVIIDSGMTYSALQIDAYNALSVALEKLLDQILEKATAPPSEPFKLCYKGVVGRDLTGLPVVTFHFADDADMVLDEWSMFMQYNEDVFCMAVLQGDLDGLSVIGTMAQQYFNFGYDLVAKKLSFEVIDCEVLA